MALGIRLTFSPPPLPVVLQPLTVGATTLDSTMAPGTVVAVISGKTPGSVVTMTGTAFSSNKLAVNAEGSAIVVGSAGPLTAADTTGTYSLVETLAGATNTPLTSGPFGSITVADGSPAPVTLQLVSLSNRYFADDAAVGSTLATVQGLPVGATFTAALEDMEQLVAAHGAPPSDALAVVGNQIRAGAGWASLGTATGLRTQWYRLRLTVTLGAQTKTNFTYIFIYSNRAHSADIPVVSVSSLSALNTALTTAYAYMNNATTGQANFKGYVIELDPAGSFSRLDHVTITPPSAGQAKKLVIRSAAADKLNGARPLIGRLSAGNGARHFLVQNLAINPMLNRFGACIDGGGDSQNVNDFGVLFRVRCKGGPRVHTAAGQWYFDQTQDFDPLNPWNDFRPYLTADLTTAPGTFDRLDMCDTARGVTVFGAAGDAGLNVWTDLTTGGRQPIHIGGHISRDGATLPITANTSTQVGSGTGFAGEMEVRWLTSGTTPPKPAPINGYTAPDGLYAVRFRRTAKGSGYTTSSVLTARPRPHAVWDTFVDIDVGMGQAFASTSVGKWRNAQIVECEALDIGKGFRPQIEAGQTMVFVGNLTDRIAGDMVQVFMRGGSSSVNTSPQFIDHFNRMGRGITDRAIDCYGLHADGMQYAGDSQAYFESVGFILDVNGSTNDQIQGAFGTDVGYNSNPDQGFIGLTTGAHVRCSNANGFVRQRALQTVNYGVQVNTNVGASGFLNYAYDPVNALVVYDDMIAGNVRDPFADPLYRLGNNLFNDTVLDGMLPSSAVYDDPVADFSLDPAVVSQRFKGIGAADGYGAFSDYMMTQVCNPITRAYDLNAIPKRVRLPDTRDVVAGSTVRSPWRRNFFGSANIVLSNFSAGLTCAVSTTQSGLAGATASGGTVNVPPGAYFEFRITAPLTGDTTITPTFTVDGNTESWSVRTEANQLLDFPAGNNLANIQIFPFGGVAAATAYPATANSIPEISNNPIPAGALALVVFAIGASSTPTIDPNTANSDQDWTIVTNANRAQSTAHRQTVYQWRNNTASPVAKKLRFSTFGGGSRSIRGALIIIPRTTAGATLQVAAAGANLSNNIPDPPLLDLGIARKALWIATASGSGANLATLAYPGGAPSDPAVTPAASVYDSATYTNLSASASGTNPASLALAFRFNEAQSEDPFRFTLTAAANHVEHTLAVYET